MNASTVPNCVSYDPTYAYELAVIIQDGLRRMMGEQENDVLLHHLHERKLHVHPPMPSGVEEGILRGMYLLQVGGQGKVRAQLMGSGTILREVIACCGSAYG